MGLQKNTASQKWFVFAFDRTDSTPKTGDAANITAKIGIDFAAANATNDVNPTETEDGFYTFDLTQAETNGDTLNLLPESVTGNVQVIGVPGVIFTNPLSFADGVVQTADHTAAIADVPTVAEFNARTLGTGSYFDPDADAVANVTLVATTTTNSDMLTVAGIADAVWDELLTGALHSTPTSAGRRLRQIDVAFEVHSGTAQSGGASSLTLDTGASASSSIYNGDRIVIVAGLGVGEHGIVIAYDGGTKVATMSKAWVIQPDVTSEFVIVPADTDVETWNNVAVTGDGDWAELQTDVDNILLDTDELQIAWTDGGRLDLILDAILLDTATIGTGGDGLTALPWNSAWDTEVESEVNDALVALHLDHLLAVDYDPDAQPGVSTALFNELIEATVGVSRFTASALSQASGSGASALEIWTYAARTLTQTAAAIDAILSGTTLTIHRGDSASIAFTALGDMSSRSQLHFTIKRKTGDPTDANALIQIFHTVGTGDTDGLLVLNGSTSVTTTDALITIDTESTGDITITIKPAATSALEPSSNYSYDVQQINTDGTVTTLTSGNCTVAEDVTRLTS